MITLDPRFPKLICKQFVKHHIRFLLSINFKKEDIETLIRENDCVSDVNLYDKKSKYAYKRSKNVMKGKFRFYITNDVIYYCDVDSLEKPELVTGDLRKEFKYEYYFEPHPIFMNISGMCMGILLSCVI